MSKNKNQLSPKQRKELLATLQARFEKNMARHRGFEWAKVKARLEAHPEKLWSLNEMERTGGCYTYAHARHPTARYDQ